MLYYKQIDVYCTTLIYFSKMELIENCKSSDDILSIDFSNSDAVLPYEEISIGSHARISIKIFFRKICNLLKKNLSLSNKLLANLRYLKPENKNIGAEKMILGVAKSMPPKFRLNKGNGCSFPRMQIVTFRRSP